MCKTFQCANMQNIDYPFWGGNRPDYCGHPGFQHAESDSVFRLQPNSSSTTGQFNCSVNGIDDRNFYLTRSTLFSKSTISCFSSVIVPVFQSAAQALEGNSSSSTSLKAALDGGFGLQWSANSDLCSQCVTSGGKCGYESGSSSFTCFCSDKAYASSCSPTQNAFSHSLPGMSIFLIIKIYCRRRRCIASVKAVAFWKKDKDDDQNVEVFMRQYGSLAPKRQYVEGEMGRPWEVVGGKSSRKRTESNQQQQEKWGKLLHLRRLHHVLAKRSGDLAGPGYSHPCTR
ncbi:unnamed protein product [Camellia sinensis]